MNYDQSTGIYICQKTENKLKLDSGHIAMTYTAIASLLILGDDLSRVNKTAVLTTLRSLQQDDGRWVGVMEMFEFYFLFIHTITSWCNILYIFSLQFLLCTGGKWKWHAVCLLCGLYLLHVKWLVRNWSGESCWIYTKKSGMNIFLFYTYNISYQLILLLLSFHIYFIYYLVILEICWGNNYFQISVFLVLRRRYRTRPRLRSSW